MYTNFTKSASVWMRSKFRRPFYKFGLPFLIFMVGGSFGLREFSKIRYQYNRKGGLRHEELEPVGVDMKKPGEVTLETEFNKIKELDIDTWENIRGPRPWEEQQAK